MMSDITANYLRISEPEHRQRYGQFFTPHIVAEFMCRWVLSEKPTAIYDPAFGLGAFFFAAKTLDPTITFVASEIDDQLLNFFHSEASLNNDLTIERQDYLLSWGEQHEAIVCNPPYMRFQKFLNRADVFRSFEMNIGANLSGYTNIASAFLLKSIHELTDDGRLAYIMPIEFLNTGYGKTVKERLVKNGLLKAIIRLEGEKEVFPNAITTTGIVLAANNGRHDRVAFYNLKQLADLTAVANLRPASLVPVEELDPTEKWLNYFESEAPSLNVSNLVRVKHYGSFSRGIATGANEFFVMSRGKAIELGIPGSLLSPCITKSAQITNGIFTNDDLQRLVEADSNVFLLNVKSKLPPQVEKYIKHGEAVGYHQRYLTRVRNSWYHLERRKPAPILFGVFSRNGFKVIRNYSDAINLTCYHCFYPNLYGQQFLDHLFLYFRSLAAQRILRQSVRQYGDSLDKFEPNDLNDALAPSPEFFATIPSQVLKVSMERCETGLPIAHELEELFSSLIVASSDAPLDTIGASVH